MDRVFGDPALLPRVFDVIALLVVSVQTIFLLVVSVHTPKEMSTYRYVILNSSMWSFLILIHIGLLVRPIAPLPEPICLITGVVKQLGPFLGGNIQFVVALTLLLNKTTAYTLCLTSNFIAYRFPLITRRVTFCKGLAIFTSVHLLVIGGMLAAAAASGLLTTHELNIGQPNFFVPSQYANFQALINDSLVLTIPDRRTIRSFFTIVYLLATLVQILLNFILMFYSALKITYSIRLSNSRHSKYRIRLRRLIVLRTLSPMVTYNIPCFLGVLALDTAGPKFITTTQWLLFLVLASPVICSLLTIFGLRCYRRAFLALFQLKPSVVLHHHSESDEESTNGRQAASKRNTISAAYTCPSLVRNYTNQLASLK